MKPVIIRGDDQLRGLLRGRREGLGIGQAELDQTIGWEEGYSAKVEGGPNRRFGRALSWFVSNMLVDLLDALGLAVVLVDRRTAQDLVAASLEAEAPVSEHHPYPGRRGAHRVSRERVYRLDVAMVA